MYKLSTQFYISYLQIYTCPVLSSSLIWKIHRYDFIVYSNLRFIFTTPDLLSLEGVIFVPKAGHYQPKIVRGLTEPWAFHRINIVDLVK